MPLNYIADARRRVARGKSKWNFLLAAFGIAGIGASWYGLIQFLIGIRASFSPSESFLNNGTRTGDFMIYVLPLFPSICLGLLAANFCIWVIPWARRALEEEARGVPGTDFKSSNVGLAKSLVLVSVLVLPLAALGATNYSSLTSEGIVYSTSLFSRERHYQWSDLSGIEAACSYDAHHVRQYSYTLLMHDGTRIEILDSDRDFLEAYPMLSEVLRGHSYTFDHHGVDIRCEENASPIWKRVLTEAPYTLEQAR